MAGATREQIEDLRGRLQARARALRDEVELVESDRADDAEPVGDVVEDAGEQAEHKRQDSVRNAEEDRDAAELRDIDAALARIDDGRYGGCADCGVDIPVERLRVQPTALRCIDCQSRFEQQHPATLKASPMT